MELGEEQTSTVPNVLSDSFVELHNPEMEFRLMLGEHLGDEFPILAKFVDPIEITRTSIAQGQEGSAILVETY